MSVPLIDFSRQYAYLKDDLEKAVGAVLKHGGYILGPEVAELEEEVAALCGVKYAIGVASGTDALLLALRAAGVESGDEVITTNFSFFATAGVVSRLGARPVFVDIDPDSYNIDPNLIEKAITKRTKAIMPVHLYGQVADMDSIVEIANKHGIKVVEDAAQAIGAEYKGRCAGSLGDFGCFSFYPTKNLGAAGDGGMIVTNSEEAYNRCRMLRVHGQAGKYMHSIVGYNSRLASMQAAVLLVKLPYLRGWSEKRIEHARKYDQAFAGMGNVTSPAVEETTTFHIYNQYTIAVPNREELIMGLQSAKIGHCVYYPVPFHRQECFANLGYAAEAFPETSKAAEQVVSIPIYPELSEAEQDEVITTIGKLVS